MSSSQFPHLNLRFNGNYFSFLIDTVADAASISGIEYEGTITNQILRSMGISGTDVHCPVMHPLEDRPPDGKPFFHKYTIISDSHLNLLGCNIMWKLGMEFIFDKNSVCLSFLSNLQLSVEPLPEDAVESIAEQETTEHHSHTQGPTAEEVVIFID